jgi:hypothetical protein
MADVKKHIEEMTKITKEHVTVSQGYLNMNMHP